MLNVNENTLIFEAYMSSGSNNNRNILDALTQLVQSIATPVGVQVTSNYAAIDPESEETWYSVFITKKLPDEVFKTLIQTIKANYGNESSGVVQGQLKNGKIRIDIAL